MAGRVISSWLFLIMFTFFMLLSITHSLHDKVNVKVDTINYDAAETIATRGEFSQTVYKYLTDRVGQYGDYIIKIKLEEQIKPGIYDTYYDESYILNKKLRVGDRVTIYLEDKDLSLYGRLLNACLLGMYPEDYLDVRIKSIKTLIVSKNGKQGID